MRGDYVEDANAYTAPVESYSPNDYGLYNMSGNVAEWTNTAFDETVYDFMGFGSRLRVPRESGRPSCSEAEGHSWRVVEGYRLLLPNRHACLRVQ